jgi:TRAP-type C4-dicarboxylate transport system permease large subunit
VPNAIFEWIQAWIGSRLVFLVLLNVFLLIVGCLMDIFSAILVVMPLILPVAKAYGVDTVHLGIIFLTNLEIGYSTPPVGLNLFISSFRFGKPVVHLYRASLPFLALYVLALLLITYIPDLSLWLVRLFGVR